jgi:hypothetical protein
MLACLSQLYCQSLSGIPADKDSTKTRCSRAGAKQERSSFATGPVKVVSLDAPLNQCAVELINQLAADNKQ